MRLSVSVTGLVMELWDVNPDSKVHGTNIWGRQDPGGPHVGPIELVIWEDDSYVSRRRGNQTDL